VIHFNNDAGLQSLTDIGYFAIDEFNKPFLQVELRNQQLFKSNKAGVPRFFAMLKENKQQLHLAQYFVVGSKQNMIGIKTGCAFVHIARGEQTYVRQPFIFLSFYKGYFGMYL